MAEFSVKVLSSMLENSNGGHVTFVAIGISDAPKKLMLF